MPSRLNTIFASWPIRKKLLLFLIVIFLPAFAVIITSGLQFRRHVIEAKTNDALLLVQSLAAQQEQIAISTRQMLSTLALLPQVKGLEVEACNELFRDIKRRYPYYTTISAVTPDGNMFASSNPFQPFSVNLADRKHIKDALKTSDFSVGEYIVGRVSKVHSLNFTYPVFDTNNTIAAVVIAGFNLDEYARFMTKANLPEGSAVIITDHAHVRLFRFPENDATALGKPLPKDTITGMLGDLDQGIFERIGQDGIRRIYAFNRLRLKEGLPPYLYLFVGIAKDEILHQANMTMLTNLLIMGAIALITIALTWVLCDSLFIKPINLLVNATRRFGVGELGARSGLSHTPDEIGRLAESFDDMASLVEMWDTKRQHELQKALDEVRTLRGIVPICASCKKIRDDNGFWSQVEKYVGDHTEATFSHSICPSCAKKLYPEYYDAEGGIKK